MKLSESLNNFEKQFYNFTDEEAQEELSSEQKNLKEYLLSKVSQLNLRNCKTKNSISSAYEKALQEGIENLYPDKHWSQITNCNIYRALFETNNNVENTVNRIVKESVFDGPLKEGRQPKAWNSMFAVKVLNAYDSGELTDDNIDEWETEYNDGRKPYPPFPTRDILRYYKQGHDIRKSADESLEEDTVKQGNHWVNKGKEGAHGEFKTKKAADAQRKAMFANGYKAEKLAEEKSLTEGYVEDLRGLFFDAIADYSWNNGDTKDVSPEEIKQAMDWALDKWVEGSYDYEDDVPEYEESLTEAHKDLSEKPGTIAYAIRKSADSWANAKTKEEAESILRRALKDEGVDTPASRNFLLHIHRQPLSQLIKTATNYWLSGADLSMKRGAVDTDKNFYSKKTEELTEESNEPSDTEVMNRLKNGWSLGKALEMN